MKSGRGWRMLIKAGVSVSELCRECRRALGKIEKEYGDFVVTSTFEGTHGAGSLHYADRAFDVRYRTYDGVWIKGERVREMLGGKFDVVEEGDHLHIEYEGGDR